MIAIKQIVNVWGYRNVIIFCFRKDINEEIRNTFSIIKYSYY